MSKEGASMPDLGITPIIIQALKRSLFSFEVNALSAFIRVHPWFHKASLNLAEIPT
jgi:hypothetical protein